MIDPMVKAIAASISDKNGWEFTTGHSSDGKDLEYMSFKVKGIYFFIDEGANLKIFPRTALADKLTDKVKFELGKTEKRDIVSLIKILNTALNERIE